MAFYDEIAGDYDAMTGSGGRSLRAEEFLKTLRRRFPINSALDVACGTGLYIILLAKLGIRSVGADVSAAMLDQARKNAQENGVRVDWVCSPMQDLAAKVQGRFDAVVCMGNSIPHLLTDGELDATIEGFVRMLNPGGIIVLQLLNYDRILCRRERIVGINRHANKEYVRFYDFQGDQVQFNILEITGTSDEPAHQLHTTLLRPYTAEMLRHTLIRHGCRNVQIYSGLGFAPFDKDGSETAMLIGSTG